MPATLCPTGRTLDQCVAQMTLMKAAPALLEAAKAARARIHADRSVHFRTSVNQHTRTVDSAEDRLLLDDYDAILRQLRAAIEAAEGRA